MWWMWMGCAGPEPAHEQDLPVDEPEIGWEDVAPILEARCIGCHTPEGPTGLPLVTWSQAHAARDVILHAVEEGWMPPWSAVGALPFRDDPTLSESEVDTLRAWVEADGPLGASPDEPILPSPPPQLPRVDLTLATAGPYTVAQRSDDVRCYVLSSERPVRGYIRGIRFAVDNTAAVHHATLTRVRQDRSQFLALEQVDPLPGFDCNEDTGIAEGDPGERIGSWLPGGGPTLFPEGSGLDVHDGGLYILSVHYTGAAAGQVDQTAVELMIEPEVERRVRLVRIVGDGWRRNLHIPAGDPAATFHYVTPTLGEALESDDPVEVLSVKLHMHRIGSTGRVRLGVRPEELDLLEVLRWDFDWQLDYWLQSPFLVPASAQLELSCTYDNSAGTQDVGWGSGSSDEMCGVELYIAEAPEGQLTPP